MRHVFPLAAIALSLLAAGAEPASAIAPGQTQYLRVAPSSGQAPGVRERAKESWTQLKRRWSLQREKYAACRKEARAQRLVGHKTRAFLKECMSR